MTRPPEPPLSALPTLTASSPLANPPPPPPLGRLLCALPPEAVLGRPRRRVLLLALDGPSPPALCASSAPLPSPAVPLPHPPAASPPPAAICALTSRSCSASSRMAGRSISASSSPSASQKDSSCDSKRLSVSWRVLRSARSSPRGLLRLADEPPPPLRPPPPPPAPPEPRGVAHSGLPINRPLLGWVDRGGACSRRAACVRFGLSHGTLASRFRYHHEPLPRRPAIGRGIGSSVAIEFRSRGVVHVSHERRADALKGSQRDGFDQPCADVVHLHRQEAFPLATHDRDAEVGERRPPGRGSTPTAPCDRGRTAVGGGRGSIVRRVGTSSGWQTPRPPCWHPGQSRYRQRGPPAEQHRRLPPRIARPADTSATTTEIPPTCGRCGVLDHFHHHVVSVKRPRPRGPPWWTVSPVGRGTERDVPKAACRSTRVTPRFAAAPLRHGCRLSPPEEGSGIQEARVGVARRRAVAVPMTTSAVVDDLTKTATVASTGINAAAVAGAAAAAAASTAAASFGDEYTVPAGQPTHRPSPTPPPLRQNRRRAVALTATLPPAPPAPRNVDAVALARGKTGGDRTTATPVIREPAVAAVTKRRMRERRSNSGHGGHNCAPGRCWSRLCQRCRVIDFAEPGNWPVQSQWEARVDCQCMHSGSDSQTRNSAKSRIQVFEEDHTALLASDRVVKGRQFAAQPRVNLTNTTNLAGLIANIPYIETKQCAAALTAAETNTNRRLTHCPTSVALLCGFVASPSRQFALGRRRSLRAGARRLVRSVPGTCGSSSGSEDEGIRNRKGVHIAGIRYRGGTRQLSAPWAVGSGTCWRRVDST
ncbi:LOW QUALITY PROTEIN: hypothetical protein BU14_0144s0013 [Porphyra umbilicalis]|uniref:Uncharacterized protein n=1 Tax=Porphyra umbilicalis TaxID=2786 RepID=A0A1X6P9P6_PORUM|nr:LOW QUALITY PROTEIN: hypothetical protein BU14_0144s0013 [Porphyra umbilicalis]|eukprot:OSX77547.1 LOW QUALITY PROTEIN: hypothetical protein BU14_0144s0013 [Porphyra umbilicalis]